MIIFEEAAQTVDEVYYALTPALAVNPKGRMILLSTPYGRSGFFFKEWHDGRGWLKLKITADECPRIAREWLEDQQASMSRWQFNQEYMCEFEGDESAFFDPEEVRAALSDEVRPILTRKRGG